MCCIYRDFVKEEKPSSCRLPYHFKGKTKQASEFILFLQMTAVNWKQLLNKQSQRRDWVECLDWKEVFNQSILKLCLILLWKSVKVQSALCKGLSSLKRVILYKFLSNSCLVIPIAYAKNIDRGITNKALLSFTLSCEQWQTELCK